MDSKDDDQSSEKRNGRRKKNERERESESERNMKIERQTTPLDLAHCEPAQAPCNRNSLAQSSFCHVSNRAPSEFRSSLLRNFTVGTRVRSFPSAVGCIRNESITA